MNVNLLRLKDIALALGELKDRVVFVGGSTVGLYIDDLAAPTPQPSEDIDCVIEIATYGEWCDFEQSLRKKGFQDFDLSGEDKNPPTCRKFIMGIKVDFMPIDEKILGYSNPWFKKGLEKSIVIQLEEVEIRIFSLEYLIAAKLKAFSDRGVTGDIRLSQDLEDLTELLDGCTDIEEKLSNAEKTVRDFIISEFSIFLVDDSYEEAMYGFLNYDDVSTKDIRLDRILNILKKICT